MSSPRSPVPAALVALAFAGTFSHADTIELPAVDFPVIDAGEVPYYVDAPREALAIDAAVLAYRDRPARATAPFTGEGGLYDVTLSVLAEVDGETTYRVLVDGAVVASVTNTPVALEFAEQRHVFENVEVPVGAELAVESSAVSNETIPENGEFAFARGRWTGLTLVSTDGGGTSGQETSGGLAGGGETSGDGANGGAEGGETGGDATGDGDTADGDTANGGTDGAIGMTDGLASPDMPVTSITAPPTSGPFEPVAEPGPTDESSAAPTASEGPTARRSSGGGASGGLGLAVLAVALGWRHVIRRRRIA